MSFSRNHRHKDIRADEISIHNKTDPVKVNTNTDTLLFTTKYINLNDKYRFYIDDNIFKIQKKQIDGSWIDKFLLE